MSELGTEAQFAAPAITIRPARDSDSGFAYFLSMDTSVRLNSTRQDLFASDQHAEWWYQRFHDPDTKIWVMEADGWAVGQVRYGRVRVDREDRASTPPRDRCKWEANGQAEIAISVLPKYRGNGYARLLLTATMPWACDWLGVDTLVALVIRRNYASRRLFRRAGFTYVGAEVRMDRIHARYEWRQT